MKKKKRDWLSMCIILTLSIIIFLLILAIFDSKLKHTRLYFFYNNGTILCSSKELINYSEFDNFMLIWWRNNTVLNNETKLLNHTYNLIWKNTTEIKSIYLMYIYDPNLSRKDMPLFTMGLTTGIKWNYCWYKTGFGYSESINYTCDSDIIMTMQLKNKTKSFSKVEDFKEDCWNETGTEYCFIKYKGKEDFENELKHNNQQ